MGLFSLTAVSAGGLRVSDKVNWLNECKGIMEYLVILGPVVGPPLLIIGAYRQARYDEEKRRKIKLLGTLMGIGLSIVGLIVVIALWA